MIKVTCAIVLRGSQVLVTQRSEQMKLPLKWEFPGGKVEPNETVEACIHRELKEELNIEIEILEQLETKPFHYTEFSIQLVPFVVKLIGGEVLLREHKNFSWLSRDQLNSLDWAPADIPVLEQFMKLDNATTRAL